MREAHEVIAVFALETHVTHTRIKPEPIAALPLPAEAANYAGWYEPINPRFAYLYAFERWYGLMQVKLAGDALELTRFSSPTPVVRYVYCGGQLLRGADEPAPTLALLRDSSEGTLIQDGGETGTTYRHLSLFALRFRIYLAIAAMLVMSTAPIVAGVWLVRRAFGRLVLGQTRWLRVFPLLGVLSLLCLVAFYFGSLDVRVAIYRFGRLTPWSGGLFLFSVLVPLFTLGGLVEACRLRREPVNKWLWWHSLLVSLALVLASAYLAESGLLVVRTWI